MLQRCVVLYETCVPFVQDIEPNRILVPGMYTRSRVRQSPLLVPLPRTFENRSGGVRVDTEVQAREENRKNASPAGRADGARRR